VQSVERPQTTHGRVRRATNLAAYASDATALAESIDRLQARLTGHLAAGIGAGDPRMPVRPIRTGPRHVVLVDDYDLLPAAAGSPLAPLLDLLARGRELGLHLVLTRSVAGSARAAFEPVFQRLRELGGPGLIMSGDLHEGPLLGGHKATTLPPGRGLLVRRRHPPTLVQVAYSPPPTAPHGPASGIRLHSTAPRVARP
jgi:ESX secretion system protein EccC